MPKFYTTLKEPTGLSTAGCRAVMSAGQQQRLAFSWHRRLAASLVRDAPRPLGSSALLLAGRLVLTAIPSAAPSRPPQASKALSMSSSSVSSAASWLLRVSRSFSSFSAHQGANGTLATAEAPAPVLGS